MVEEAAGREWGTWGVLRWGREAAWGWRERLVLEAGVRGWRERLVLEAGVGGWRSRLV